MINTGRKRLRSDDNESESYQENELVVPSPKKQKTTLFPNLPNKKFHVIYADPPWQYRSSRGRGSAESHYPTVSIKQLIKFPIDQVADQECCALLMWTTAPQLNDALQLINAWGFEYKTIFFTWIKTLPNTDKPRLGMGHYTRSSTEICLLGVRGQVSAQLKHSSGVQQTILAPTARHSEKPEEAKKRIEEFFGAAEEKLELFARCAAYTDQWTVWGNEAIEQ